jgi:hypothetical protein
MRAASVVARILSYPLAFVLAANAVAETPPSASSTPRKPRIERADQLPARSYKVPETVRKLFFDSVQFATLSQELQANLLADLDKYQIDDRATLRWYFETLAIIALLQRRYDASMEYLDCWREQEDKPASRLMSGLQQRAILSAAKEQPERYRDAFRAAYEEALGKLPYPEVQFELKREKNGMEIVTRNLAEGVLVGVIEPAAKEGTLSEALAHRLIRLKLLTEHLLPVADVAADVLGKIIQANTVEKPEIWKARALSLTNRAGLAPVIVGIWDEGVDVQVFPQNLFVNAREIPGNGLDDDGNGFIDDVHGIGFTDTAEKSAAVLRQVTMTTSELAEAEKYSQGSADAQLNLGTPEAQLFQAKVSGLAPEQVKKFFENLQEYGYYAHGTTVGSIAASENPAARLMVARLAIFDFHLPPRVPTIEQARADAREFRDTVQYFKQHGVRVVNMSWTYGPQEVEGELAANGAGGNAEERRSLARRIYEIKASALHAALKDAPDILFTVAAGNSNSDNRFGEEVPSALGLANILTVGAVDHAGDEAGFTSYGQVDVYASGYLRDIVVPGGKKMLGSGTSYAAPEVANLAAKLCALYPDASCQEVRAAILLGAEEKTVSTDKKIKLLHPQKSLELLAKARSR